MDNNSSNKNNSNKPNNKVNMPKFNLNWMYMIIALMLLGLWWGSDSRGAGNKAVTANFRITLKTVMSAKCWGMRTSRLRLISNLIP